MVAADVEDLEPLQVEVAVECLGEHLIWGYQDVEGPGNKRDGGVDMVASFVPINVICVEASDIFLSSIL